MGDLAADFSLSNAPFPAGWKCCVGSLLWVFQTTESDYGAGGIADQCVS